MQGPRLAALLALLAAFTLSACGGEETSTSPQGETESSPLPGIEKLEERTEQIKEERQEVSKPREAGEEQGRSTSSQSSNPPAAKHDDSGGGVAQFRRKGHDNSIQELGQEGSPADRARAAAVLHAYLDARVAGRWDEACSYLSAPAVALIEQFDASYGKDEASDCAKILQALFEAAGEGALRAAAQADVGALRLDGDHGFLLYHGVNGLDFAAPVVEEAGEWKLSAPEGSPLP